MKRKTKQSNQVTSNEIALSWQAQQYPFLRYLIQQWGIGISYNPSSHCLELSFPTLENAKSIANARYYFNELGFNISIVHAGQQIAQFRTDDVMSFASVERWVECTAEPCQWSVVEGQIIVFCSSASDACLLWRTMDWRGMRPLVEGKYASIWIKGDRLFAASAQVLSLPPM
jgi:hypothetical protein